MLSGGFFRGRSQLEQIAAVTNVRNILEVKRASLGVTCSTGSGLGLTFSSSYKVAVTAANEGGPGRVDEYLLTTPALSGPVQATTSGGVILLNGQPSFPKMVWAQCTDAVAANPAEQMGGQ